MIFRKVLQSHCIIAEKMHAQKLGKMGFKSQFSLLLVGKLIASFTLTSWDRRKTSNGGRHWFISAITTSQNSRKDQEGHLFTIVFFLATKAISVAWCQHCESTTPGVHVFSFYFYWLEQREHKRGEGDREGERHLQSWFTTHAGGGVHQNQGFTYGNVHTQLGSSRPRLVKGHLMATIKMQERSADKSVERRKSLIHCWWGCKLVHWLLKETCRFLKKIKNRISHL